MKRKQLLLMILMALMVPSVTWAQIQSTPLGPGVSYETDFQTLTDWIPHNDNTNGWCIDNAIYRTFSRSLYATATPASGSSHPEYYVVGDNATYSYMTRLFFMEAGAYQIEYFYIGGIDYLYNISPSPRVALVEGNHSFPAGHNMNYSIGDSQVFYIDTYVDNSNPNIPLTRILPYTSTWSRITETVVIPESGFYTLVFALEIPFGTAVGYAWKMGFDDLSIQYIEPYDLAFTDINHQSAKLTWKSINADSWEVQYRRTSPTTTEWVHRTGLTGRSCTLNNLPTLADATTNYEVQVRANFSDGVNSAWVTTQFSAPRTPNMIYPYTTDFENQSDDADWCITPTSFLQSNELGYCTETFGINVVSEPENVLDDRCLHVWNSLYDETKMNYFPNNPNAGMLSYAVCFAKKSFNFSRGDYSLVFDWAGKGEAVQSISTIHSTGDFLHVFLAPIGADLNNIMERKLKNHQSTEGVIPITDLQRNAFTQGTFSTPFSIDTETAGEYWLVFAWVNDLICYIPYERYAFAVDNLTLDLTTTFPMPTDLAVSPSANSATFSWTGQESASSYTIQYKEASASTWTTVTPDTNPYTLTGLTNGTNYVAQLRINYDNNTNHSEWVAFDPFRTLMQDVVALNASNTSYYEDFQNGNGDWAFINGSDISGEPVNRWRRFSVKNINYGDLGYGLRVTYSADNSFTTSWSYRKRRSYTINGQTSYLATPATSYAVKTFALSEGHYEFTYNYAVKGIANEDYMRVVLVPAETIIEAGVLSDGFSYNSTPEGWASLDGGQQLVGDPNNNDYYGWTAHSPVSLDVYPGSSIEPGNYMMVVLWKNEGSTTRDGQNPPGAIDNVSITWSELLTPPDMNTLVVTESDTQTELIWSVPNCGLTPTGYEVEYAANNNFTDALTASTEMNGIMLMGLTPHTSYYVRIRSAYTANGATIYSDWSDARAFTTLYPRPTDLAVEDQTTSWAYVEWAPVEMELPEGQYINYWWQLTTDLDDWGESIGQGQVSPSWAQNFTPGTYYFHVKTAVYDSDGYLGESNWSEPLAFTIAPWTDPVTIFPFVEDFDEFSDRFADGLTLDGDYEHLDLMFYTSEEPTPGGGENGYKLRFHSCSNKTACLVLPPLRPSTSDASVSFWWYHDNSGGVNEGVAVEHSSDGSSWTSFGTMIPRYAEETGWVKYSFVVPSPTSYDKVYVRLHFYGSNTNQWTNCCYLDDLTVNNFKSYQPYISYVGCNANTATITLYDYGYENGWPSSAFQVQYREYRNPGEPEEEWITYTQFDNEEPYAFVNTLTVTGLQPTTLYEFRACARASYGGFDFPWSNYCEPFRQWTSCGTYTITPTQSYTMDFEDEFYYNCWSGDIDETAWHVTTDDAHSGTNSFCVNGNTWKVLSTPTIDLTQLSNTTDNVVMRFWAKTSTTGCQVLVRYTYNGSTYNPRYMFIPKTDEWKQFEISLSKRMGREITVEFKNGSANTNFYLDDVEIVANPYSNTKIFDLGEDGNAGNWTTTGNWFPTGIPDGNTDVRILEGNATVQTNVEANAKSVFVGPNGRLTVKGILNVDESLSSNIAKINTGTNGEITGSIIIGSAGVLNAASLSVVDSYSFKVNDGGATNVTTLNPGEANSVVVKDGGLLNATTITTANAGANDRVVIKDGGQVKTDNPFYATIEKDITGYGAENVDSHTGWYLVAPTTQVMAVPTFVPQIGSEYQFDQMDFYWFNGNQELEWYNPKCPAEGGCDSPWGIIPQGQFSAEVAQPLHGYLYARQEDGTLQFAAGIVGNTPFPATNEDTEVSLSFASNSTTPLNGWNLIGNPYTCNAYLVNENNEVLPFYRMNETGDAVVPAQAGTAIKPCEGVFVVCPNDGQSHSAVFTTTEPATNGEVQDVPMVTVPVHALMEDQDAYLILRQLAELAEGWNWWAPTVQTSVADLQAALGDDLETILAEDGELTDGATILEPGQMYKIRTSDGCTLNVLGIVVPNVSLSIEPGMNWFGCTLETGLDDLGVTPATGDKIISQSGGFAIFNGSNWEGTLTSLMPGQGYVYVSVVTE